jgi:hypothetical protein
VNVIFMLSAMYGGAIQDEKKCECGCKIVCSNY